MSNETHHHHDGKRVEDHRLITGAGRFASDWNASGQLALDKDGKFLAMRIVGRAG